MNNVCAIAKLDEAAATVEVILADMFLHGGTVLGDKLEKQLASRMYAGYLKRARVAFSKAVKKFERGTGKSTHKEMRDIARGVGKELADIPDDDINFFVRKTAQIYAITRKHWLDELRGKIKQRSEKAKKPEPFKTSFGVTFDTVDQEAIEAMSSNQIYWIGDQYGKKVQAGILDKAETEIFEKGLGREEAARPLRDILNREMGLTVPAQFRGTGQEYFEGIAGLVRVQSNSFASTRAFGQAGAIKYEVSAVGDERTCPECAFMDGTIFTTGQGESHIGRLGKARTPEQVKSVNKWLKRPAMMKLAGVKTPGAKKSLGGIKRMARAGLALPPYHFRCRCTVEPTEFG